MLAKRLIPASAALALLTGIAMAEEVPRNPLTDSPTWEFIRGDIIGEAQIAAVTAPFSVEAPFRAHDAATVPVVLTQTDPAARIERAVVVIDENPAPLAATFAFGAGMGQLDFEFRVRVNQYSNLRVLTDTPTVWPWPGAS